MPIRNENSNGEFFYFNKETGKMMPKDFRESLSFDFTLSEDAVAMWASILEPLGDLEIVPNNDKPSNGGKSDKYGGDGYDA